MTQKTIFWFRQDLRIFDNPGLYQAVKNGSVMAIYILDEENAKDFKMGEASRYWLHHSLSALNKSLDDKLNFYCGKPSQVISKLIEDYQINAVYWNRCYEPWRIKEDSELKTFLKSKDIDCQSFNSLLLWEPWEVAKIDKTPYKVFTPFYKKGCLQANEPREPLPRPEKLALIKDLNSSNIEKLELLPTSEYYSSMENYWQIGEDNAQEILKNYLEDRVDNYKEGRNFPSQNHTSALSPYLHFGEISVNQVWYSVQYKKMLNPSLENSLDCFLSELGWREFSYYTLYHFPDLPTENLQKKFDQFPWQSNNELLQAWQTGQTGYPIVDAGMRELRQTGYMHNRLRMIVGSFLTKNLLLDWRLGAAWFWDCLFDADLASNSAGWQWVAGTGVDSAPYFRIFNPIIQGEKFDEEGTYTKRFIPELALLPAKYLFKPWEAPALILKAAGIVLGENYPKPIVDFAFSRERALAAFSSLTRQE